MVKLLSTEIGENWIELTYADNPNTDDASRLLVVRLPRKVDQARSLAWNRHWALTELREFIGEQIEADRRISEGRA
jgi:hypothetical protein